MSERKTIGKKIIAKREELNLSQENLAALVGLSATALSHIENGKVYVNTKNLYKICKVLEIKLVEIFEGY